MLHHETLGAAGRLALARVAGPGGRVVWNAPLPLLELHTVLPDGTALIVAGRGLPTEEPGAAGARTDEGPAPEPHERLGRDGGLATFDLTEASLRDDGAD